MAFHKSIIAIQNFVSFFKVMRRDSIPFKVLYSSYLSSSTSHLESTVPFYTPWIRLQYSRILPFFQLIVIIISLSVSMLCRICTPEQYRILYLIYCNQLPTPTPFFNCIKKTILTTYTDCMSFKPGNDHQSCEYM